MLPRALLGDGAVKTGNALRQWRLPDNQAFALNPARPCPSSPKGCVLMAYRGFGRNRYESRGKLYAAAANTT